LLWRAVFAAGAAGLCGDAGQAADAARSLKITRALVNAALDGRLDKVEFVTESAFGLSIPVSCPEVPAEILNPRNSWADKEAYDKTAADLASRFAANFQQFDASEAIRAAGPKAK
jgi:phosphoenolpyruvate carboxykinase (ATP)